MYGCLCYGIWLMSFPLPLRVGILGGERPLFFGLIPITISHSQVLHHTILSCTFTSL